MVFLVTPTQIIMVDNSYNVCINGYWFFIVTNGHYGLGVQNLLKKTQIYCGEKLYDKSFRPFFFTKNFFVLFR